MPATPRLQSDPVRIVLLTLAYFGAGLAGQSLSIAQGTAPVVWPPAGIAIGALLLFGTQLWPGVFVGSLLGNLIAAGLLARGAHLSAATIASACLVAAGAALQPLVVSRLVANYIGIPLRLRGWDDAFRLFILAVPVGCVIGPVCRVAAAAAFANVAPAQLSGLWLSWWLAEMFGGVVFLPLMLLTAGASATTLWRGRSLGAISLLGVVALLVPIAVAFYAWNVSKHLLHEKAAANFAALAKESERALQYRIQLYEQALRAGAGFWLGSESVSRSEWRAFSDAMDMARNYPGMRGMGWIYDVPQANLAAFIAVRQQENPDFHIAPAGEFDRNFIITYIEPKAANERAIGFNIASEANRLDAALTAIRTGKVALTRHIRLVQDTAERTGFLLLLPVSKPSAVAAGSTWTSTSSGGWVYAPLIGDDFIDGLTYSQDKLFTLRIFEASETSDHLLYTPRTTRRGTPVFTVRRSIDVGQQQWQIVWASTPEFETASASLEPALILTIGLLSTAIFGALLLVSSRREQVIEELVLDRTQQLRASQDALRSSEATLRASMEHAAIGMALVDISGKWLQANRSLCLLLGYRIEELQATDFQTITHPDDLEKDLNLLRQTLSGQLQSYQMEKRYFHKDGHTIWALLTVALVRDAQDQPQYFVSQIQDISQRREMDRLKNEFISTVSHELRTPLTAIRGSLGLLASGSLGMLPPKAHPMVRIAHSNSERLVRIINDILDIERIESGRLELTMSSVPLASMLALSIEANQAYAGKYAIRLQLCDVPSEIQVSADPDRLMQVMANLLSNAAKFSPPDSAVTVRVVVASASVTIEVEDCGTGIPESFGNRIFDKFVQVDSSSSRRFDGTGLGLSITKQLVEAMGGRIEFSSQVGKGTVFRFSLMRTAAPLPQSPAEPPSLATPRCVADGLPRILHVEDDGDICGLIATSLSGQADVVHAATVRAARQLLREQSFELALVDLLLPDGDGTVLIEEIHALHPATAIIVLSVAELPRTLRPKVAAALVKSRASEAAVVDQVLAALNSVRTQ